VCDPLDTGGVLLRVRVESAEADRIVATVDRVFPPADSEVDFVQMGDRIGGALYRQQPCVDQPGELPAPGSELFVLYNPGATGNFPNCAEFHACAQQQCSDLSEPDLTDCWASCDFETEQVCNEHRSAALLDGFFGFAIPWAEPLDFGAQHELSQDQLEVLATPEACLERFPPDPAPPCNDSSSGPCTIAQTAPPSPTPSPWSVWLAALAFAALVRRYRRPA
jgi:MYXO-CTERM domain-containing protein